MEKPENRTPKSLISIVIPVFNEEHNIKLIHQAIARVWRNQADFDFKLIFVNDGSADDTWSEIVSLAKIDHAVRGLDFSRNFGKEAAIEAGLKEAEGDAIIVIDGDLQHPPELISEMINKWQEGKDIVLTKNLTLMHPGLLKRLFSNLFYKFFNLVSDVAIEPGSSDFCLLSRQAVDALNALPEKQKFYRGLTHWAGFQSTTIFYNAVKRTKGKSAYSFRKLFALARTAIISSSTLPMTIIIMLGGFLVFFGAVVTLGLLLYKYFVSWEFIGAASVLGAFIVLNNGLLFVAFGIMSLYQVAIYKEVQNRPSYIIQETTNSSPLK